MSDSQTKVTTSHWGAFEVTTKDDRIVSVAPFEGDLTPSDIPSAVPAAVHHKTRVARPSFRKGWLDGSNPARDQRGSDEFIELPWDEALDITSQELKRVTENYGNGSIFGGSYGWASAGRFHHSLGQLHRFLNTIGGYVSSFASYSTAGAQAIMPHVFGMLFLKFTHGYQNSWSNIAEHTQSLVMFGGINPKNSQVSMGGVTRHETATWFDEFEKRGMRRVNISPQIDDTPAGAEWLPIIPGTDTAMMLAMAYVLETENLADRDFLKRCTEGYEKFLPYLLGTTDQQPKTPEWAATICGIDAKTIAELARHMARTRTLITIAWSLQRAENGEQPYWMASTLAAMLGQIGLPGGGVGFGYGAIGGIGVAVKRLGGITLPQGDNPIEDFIPVARVADMLLNPNGAYQFNGQNRQYPDIKLVYWCGGNPFHHHQDLNRLHAAFQKPETIIVHEPWWTATAQRADIVLPATSPYEREDIGRAMGDSYLFHMPKLISPVEEARNDFDIFSGLANRMDKGSEFTENRNSSEWIQHLYDEFRDDAIAQGVQVPTLDELREKNWVNLPIHGPEHSVVPFEEFRQDPVASPLGTPSGRIEIFSSTVESFGYEECAGHAIWRAPEEWVGAKQAQNFPLHLVSPQPGDKLHSQLESALADRPGERPARLCLHPNDADSRTITEGVLVKVFNGRGACMARAHLTDRLRAGVVSLPTGAWYNPGSDGIDAQGNPNVLTRDKGTSRIGQGSSAHTTLVEVVVV
ncbi:MAG: biotin/methionine sulfoxide reductase [Parasphingorhabdus sp.]|jgi:biotin/methionine sulfoxide reductase